MNLDAPYEKETLFGFIKPSRYLTVVLDRNHPPLYACEFNQSTVFYASGVCIAQDKVF